MSDSGDGWQSGSVIREEVEMVVLDQLDYQSVVAFLFLLFCPPLSSTILMQVPNKDFCTFMEFVLTRSMNVSTTIWRS